MDSITGLHYFGYRYYDAKTGRWISREPLGEGESSNLYSYCHGDPINNIDQLGLKIYGTVLELVNGEPYTRMQGGRVMVSVKYTVQSYRGAKVRTIRYGWLEAGIETHNLLKGCRSYTTSTGCTGFKQGSGGKVDYRNQARVVSGYLMSSRDLHRIPVEVMKKLKFSASVARELDKLRVKSRYRHGAAGHNFYNKIVLDQASLVVEEMQKEGLDPTLNHTTKKAKAIAS